ncbi:hemerythrin domain-containing protein [Actinokineospora sp. 24-640]
METNLSTEHGFSALPGHLHAFALTHRAMRRDARRLRAGVPEGGVAKAASWWRQVRAVIDWHHHTEDEILWPAIRARLDPATEKAMHADHAALDTAMDGVTAALVPGSPDLPAAASRFHDVLIAHLRAEESAVLPVFVHQLTRSEYGAVERRIIGSAGPSIMLFLPAWLLDGASGFSSAAMPPPVRLIGATALRWNYHRQWKWW